VYERHKTELLTDGAGAGGSSHSTPTSAAAARKKAAKAAALVNHGTDSMYQLTSVLNTGLGGGKKQLRGINTTRVLTDYWERTGRVVEKTPSKGGKSYVNEVLQCKVPGCRVEREHLRPGDGALSSATGNLINHIRKAHPRKQAMISMKTVVVVKPDGTNTRTIALLSCRSRSS
jgi:hypothetical protein